MKNDLVKKPEKNPMFSCPKCNGSGKISNKICPKCKGTGKVLLLLD
jgi:DnaJ-class molecular chaperone